MKIILKQIDDKTRIVLTNRLLGSVSFDKCYALERKNKFLFWNTWSTTAWIYAHIMNYQSSEYIEEWLFWSEGIERAYDIDGIKKKFGV